MTNDPNPTPGTYGIHCRFGQSEDASPRTYTYLVHPQQGEVREGDVCVVRDPRGEYRFVLCVGRAMDLSQSLRKASAGGYRLKYIVAKIDPTLHDRLERGEDTNPDMLATHATDPDQTALIDPPDESA